MLEQGRYPTHEEVEAVIARARLMRSRFVGALIARGVQRAKQLLLWRNFRVNASWLLFRAARHLHPDLR